MTVSLIGAHRAWDGNDVSPSQRDRFAAALGIFESRPAQSSYDGELLLASTGEQRGWKPQLGPDGSRILFAGHIDNRKQVADDLGVECASNEVLYAAAFARWGDAADLRVIGQFATIVVPPHGKHIRLSRSPIAAPPLFYHHDSNRVIVSSFVNAMFATGELERRMDYRKVAHSLFQDSRTATRSYFEGISKLPCGHRAIATSAGMAIDAYYDLSALPEVRLKDDRDYVIAATELLEAGVSAALDGFSRPAISLSGGLDSQAVAALAARLRPGQPIEAFTCVPERGWHGRLDSKFFGDERPFVEALARMYPEIRPHWVDAAERNFDHRRTSVFLAAGDTGPAVLGHFTHEIYAQARARGCDVILEMPSGNDTFSFGAHGALPTMVRRGEWLQLWREAGHIGKKQSRSTMRVIANQALYPLAPDWLHVALARLFRRPEFLDTDPYTTWCQINREFAASMGVLRSTTNLNNYRLPNCSRQTRLDNLGHGYDDSGESVQAFGILYGMESRDPTIYRPLVEFCLGIPDNQYLRNGQTRWLARRMLKGLVPDVVVSETRRGARAPDLHHRLDRQRSDLIAEFDRLIEDEGVTSKIDLKSLRQRLIDLPEEHLIVEDHDLEIMTVLDGLVMAQFIRFVEGRNN